MTTSPNCKICGEANVDLELDVCLKCQSHDDATVPPTPSRHNDATIAPSGPGPRGSSSTLGNQAFGEYELLEEIARGGMGVVYKARHRTLGRITAIKMILSGKFSSQEELQRFNIEASAAARLDHPGIVPVYEIGESEGQAYFAMKYIEGGSLADQIQGLRNRPRDAVEMLTKVAKAVHHAHQRGILHRDLKPANILIDEDNQPLLTDLGLAKSTTGGSDLTHTGAVIGTPSYMPPEQASGGTVTTASDTYSLGAILYELLTGQPPHQGSSAIDTVMKVLAEPPVDPSKIAPDIDRDLELICMKCLDRDPDSRYDSANAFAEDLTAWLESEPISVRPPNLSAIAGRWFRKHRKLIYFAFGIIVGCLFSLPFLLLFSSTSMDEVYSYFPESKRSLIFRMGFVPPWVSAIAMMILVLGIWPSIGFFNAAISGAKSIRQALWNGVLTAFLFSIVVAPLLGWMIVAQSAVNSGNYNIRVLTRAVWAPNEDERENVLDTANGIFGGVEHIPKSERARIVAERIKIEQLGSTGTAFIILAGFIAVFAVPMIYGTLIGWILLSRNSNRFVSFIRYMVVWWSTLVLIPVCLSSFRPVILPLHQNRMLIPFVILIIVTMIYLSLRRWRKPTAEGITRPSSAAVA